MLHLMFKTESHNRKDRLGIIAIRHTFNKSRHLVIDVRAVAAGFGNRRPRASPAFRSRHAGTKSFVIRVEVKEKFVRVSLVSRLIFLQHCLKKPGRVTDVPARWTHEFRGLDYVVFNLQRRNDFESARADLVIEISDGSKLSFGWL